MSSRFATAIDASSHREEAGEAQSIEPAVEKGSDAGEAIATEDAPGPKSISIVTTPRPDRIVASSFGGSAGGVVPSLWSQGPSTTRGFRNRSCSPTTKTTQH